MMVGVSLRPDEPGEKVRIMVVDFQEDVSGVDPLIHFLFTQLGK
jgi:hypothetical protein